MKLNALIPILFAFLPTNLIAASESPLKVFICAGQSNMVGKRSTPADLTDASLREPQRNLIFRNGEWQQIEPGRSQSPDGFGFGPEISFTAQMSEALNEPIGIIKYSKASTSLGGHWNPARKNEKALYPQLKELVVAAQKSRKIEIVGVIWMQGESDALDDKSAASYGENLDKLIVAFRSDFETPNMLFVAGRINPKQQTGPFNEKVTAVRAHIEKCTASGYAWVDCDDLPKVKDDVHYTTAGLETLGLRMAEAMSRLMKQPVAAPE